MGRLDAFDVGKKKLTIQTEFFPRPNWRIETKVYLGGELKKTYTDDLERSDEPELQRRLDQAHDLRMKEIEESLRKKKR